MAVRTRPQKKRTRKRPPTQPKQETAREILHRCLDIAEGLIASRREPEALKYLQERVLPVIEQNAQEEMRLAARFPASGKILSSFKQDWWDLPR